MDGTPTVWLVGCCPLFSRMLARLEWRGWQGILVVLSAQGGPMLGCFVCTRGTCTLFLRIEALQGSLPDNKCETDVNIAIFLEK